MHTFAEALHRVRIERGFTQEKLAQEMNVSRQTISHWENGRAFPDIDTIKRISHVLGYSFLTEDTPVAEETPAADVPVKETKKIRRIVIAAIAVLMMIVAAFSVGFMVREIKNQKAAAFVSESHTYEWYTAGQEPVEGQAYARIEATEDPIIQMVGGNCYFTFNARFSGDADFCIERLYLQYFKNGAAEGPEWITEQDRLIEVVGTPWYGPGDVFEWSGGSAALDLTQVGIAIEGTDANGNHLIFTGCAEISKELRK